MLCQVALIYCCFLSKTYLTECVCMCVFAGITGDCMLVMLEEEYTAGVCQTILVSLLMHVMNNCMKSKEIHLI